VSDDRSWADAVADAAKGAVAGVGAASIIASSPAVGLPNTGLTFNDPVADSAITALADANDAMGALTDAWGQADSISEATDVAWEPTTSLIVDPPEWGGSMDDLGGDDLSASGLDGAGAGDMSGGLF